MDSTCLSRDIELTCWRYIWKPAKYDENGNRQPPNNWSQLLGDQNSGWTWDEKTQEYYLSLFTPEQPDLNWECPAVREAVHDVMKFWLDRGASGFRMDVINHISKVQTFPDAPITDPGFKYQPGHKVRKPIESMLPLADVGLVLCERSATARVPPRHLQASPVQVRHHHCGRNAFRQR